MLSLSLGNSSLFEKRVQIQPGIAAMPPASSSNSGLPDKKSYQPLVKSRGAGIGDR
jgi:hypothetical protein